MLLWALLNTVTRARWARFDSLNQALAESQERLLLTMLRRAADTEFGRAHGFAGIRDRAAYQAQVPIGSWDSFSPYIDRIVGGARGVLTNDPAPRMFNRTSGTTSAPKLIPVSPHTIRGNALTQKLWAFQAIRRHPKFLSGKALPMVNKAVEGYTDATRTPYGSVSGLMFRDAHPMARARYAYPYDVVEIPDYRARRYALMRNAVPQDVSFIPGSNANSIVKLFELADEAKEDLVRDVHDGTLSPAYDIPQPIRGRLQARLAPDRARARTLERFAEAGALRPRDYWPSLRLIGCWKGGTVGQFARQLHDWCGPELTLRDTGYMSSEAHVSIPITDDGSEGLLTIHTNVFEFVPEDEWGQPGARALFADQIEPGGTYQILLTTPAGLYRYAINDVIEVVGRHRGAPLVRFLRKGRDVISIHGEKISANQVIHAMEAAVADTGARLRHYMFVPDPEQTRYALHVEFEGEEVPALAAAFDARLSEQNYLFRGLLAGTGMLSPTVLRTMRPGWFDAITEAQVAAGMRDTQFKPTVIGPAVLAPDYIARELDAAP